MNPLSYDEVAIERALGAKSLRDYIRQGWKQVEPVRTFMDNWHIDALSDHLEAVTRGEIRRLVINVPPGTMKSLSCSVFWPTWAWIQQPESKWITASYSGIISRRDGRRARHLMETRWYQERWGHLWSPNVDDWSNLRYSNDQGGLRLTTTPGGGATGEHADYQLVDDPIKPLEAPGARMDSAALSECIEWWDETMSSRVVDPATSRRVIIMQRLHERDLAGYVLGKGTYEHLCLPMVSERRCVVNVSHPCSMKEDARGEETPPGTLGFKDPRPTTKEAGIKRLLWEGRFPTEVVKGRKKEFGTKAWVAQDQQRPTPAGGGIFKRDWVQYWREYPRGRIETIQSWDCTFKNLDDSDYVVGQAWARAGGQYFLVGQVRDQMSVSGTCKALLAFSAKHKKARKKLIEDKANGPAVIQLMKKTVPGLIAVNPQGGKIVRANAVEPLWEAGNVFIPDPSLPGMEWVHDFVEEYVVFNGDPGRPDDQVDAMTQALIYLHKKTVGDYQKAMKNIGSLAG